MIGLSPLMTALTAFTVGLILAAVIATVLVRRAEAQARVVLRARWEQTQKRRVELDALGFAGRDAA